LSSNGFFTGRTQAFAQGLVLPGVAVAATGAQGVKTTATAADGRFTLAFLTPGTYVIHVDLQGFTPIDRRDVQVRLGQTVEMPLTMQIGGVEETIQVVSTAPTLDTTNTTVGESLDSATLSRLPVGRRFSDTIYLLGTQYPTLTSRIPYRLSDLNSRASVIPV
jgi:carboxypeptidase family protein